MPVPQAILDALNVVQTDADDLTAKQSAASAASAALVSATATASAATAAVASSQQQLAADLAALVALEEQTYGPLPMSPLARK